MTQTKAQLKWEFPENRLNFLSGVLRKKVASTCTQFFMSRVFPVDVSLLIMYDYTFLYCIPELFGHRFLGVATFLTLLDFGASSGQLLSSG